MSFITMKVELLSIGLGKISEYTRDGTLLG